MQKDPLGAEWRTQALAFIDRVDRDQNAYIEYVCIIAATLADRFDRYPARNIPPDQLIEVERAWRSIPVSHCTVDQLVERQRRRLHIRDTRVASGTMAPLQGLLGDPSEPAVVLCYSMLTIDRRGYRIETPPLAYVGVSAIARWFQRHSSDATEEQLISDIAALVDVPQPTEEMLGDTLDITLPDGVWRALASTIHEPEAGPSIGLAVKKWINNEATTAQGPR